jgi:hypothetical protein
VVAIEASLVKLYPAHRRLEAIAATLLVRPCSFEREPNAKGGSLMAR